MESPRRPLAPTSRHNSPTKRARAEDDAINGPEKAEPVQPKRRRTTVSTYDAFRVEQEAGTSTSSTRIKAKETKAQLDSDESDEYTPSKGKGKGKGKGKAKAKPRARKKGKTERGSEPFQADDSQPVVAKRKTAKKKAPATRLEKPEYVTFVTKTKPSDEPYAAEARAHAAKLNRAVDLFTAVAGRLSPSRSLAVMPAGLLATGFPYPFSTTPDDELEIANLTTGLAVTFLAGPFAACDEGDLPATLTSLFEICLASLIHTTVYPLPQPNSAAVALKLLREVATAATTSPVASHEGLALVHLLPSPSPSDSSESKERLADIVSIKSDRDRTTRAATLIVASISSPPPNLSAEQMSNVVKRLDSFVSAQRLREGLHFSTMKAMADGEYEPVKSATERYNAKHVKPNLTDPVQRGRLSEIASLIEDGATQKLLAEGLQLLFQAVKKENGMPDMNARFNTAYAALIQSEGATAATRNDPVAASAATRKSARDRTPRAAAAFSEPKKQDEQSVDSELEHDAMDVDRDASNGGQPMDVD